MLKARGYYNRRQDLSAEFDMIVHHAAAAAGPFDLTALWFHVTALGVHRTLTSQICFQLSVPHNAWHEHIITPQTPSKKTCGHNNWPEPGCWFLRSVLHVQACRIYWGWNLTLDERLGAKSFLGADQLISGGGLWFSCVKKDCSAKFKKKYFVFLPIGKKSLYRKINSLYFAISEKKMHVSVHLRKKIQLRLLLVASLTLHSWFLFIDIHHENFVSLQFTNTVFVCAVWTFATDNKKDKITYQSLAQRKVFFLLKLSLLPNVNVTTTRKDLHLHMPLTH